MSEFVPANQLYDVDSRTSITHPSTQATDDDVRRALEALDDREVRTDGGCSSSVTDRRLFERVWATALWYVNGSDDVERVSATIHEVAEELEQLTDDEIAEITNLEASDILASLQAETCNVQPGTDRKDGGSR